MNLNSYLDKVECERIVTPEATDAHFMRVTTDRHGMQMQRVVVVQPVLERVAELRKENEETNGFWRGKANRAIGSIPNDAWLGLLRLAGGDTQELERLEKKWLRLHPEFCSVSAQSF